MRAGRWPSAGASHSSARWSCPCRGRRRSLGVGEGGGGGGGGVEGGGGDAGAGDETARVGGQQRAELDEDAQAVLRAGVYGGLGGAGAEADAAPVMVEM